MTTAAEVSAKDPERAEIEALLADWQAKGGIPEYPTSCRAEKTMMNMRQLNESTWEARK